MYKDKTDFSEIQTHPEKKDKEILMQEKLYNIYEQSKNDFIKKSFGERYYSVYWFACYGFYFFAFLSIANAVGFFYGKMYLVTGVYVALLLALLGTSLIEFLKALFFNLACKSFYKEKISTIEKSVLSLLFGVLLVVSIFTSIWGAEEVVQMIDTRQARQEQTTESQRQTHHLAYQRQMAEAEKTHLAYIASLKADYAKRIQAEQNGLAEYKQSVTWEGKINIHNPANAYNINAYQTRISELQASLQKEIDLAHRAHKAKTDKADKQEAEAKAHIDLSYQKRTQANSQSHTYYLWFWVSIAGVTEVLIMLCSWFEVHYKYYLVIAEPKKVGLAKSPMENLADSFKSFLYLMLGRQDLPQHLKQDLQDLKQDLPQHLPQNNMGFEVGKKKKKQDLPEGYQPPATLEQALKEGIIEDPRILTAIYKININTLTEARKALQKEAPSTRATISLFDAHGSPIAGKEVRHV